jgi:1-aminocyclopropane-1-carboxylate deaminase/D-cysteine desulfhydrase-like pyridoxal-dependent ACC family enzyme
MRFVEDNAHGQCKHCNSHLAGNHVAYRAGLIARIGLHAVERIESDQTVRKYSKEGLIELARHYNAEARRLKREAITPPVHQGATHDTTAHQFV